MQLAGLASNRGRNLMHIADRSPGGATVAVVVTDSADAPVTDEAEERGVPTETVVHTDGESRRDHERRLLEALSGYDVDLVALDGYMRILSDTALDAMPTVLNVHPALLPSFPGMNPHEAVLGAGVALTGCTVHVVTDATDEDGTVIEDRVDAGPIVTQEPVPVYEGDDADALKRRVLYRGEFRAYPRAIRWFASGRVTVETDADGRPAAVTVAGDTGGDLPERRLTAHDRAADMRYGENPHQSAALYAEHTGAEASVVHAEQLNEGAKALSYNNYNDADAALNLVKEFDEPAAAVIKHTNPAGCATADTVSEAYAAALATDPMSAFGGIVALNRECDAATAERIIDSFKEVVVAPGYTGGALDTLLGEQNLRVLEVEGSMDATQPVTERPLVGGRLVQQRDTQRITPADLEVVTEREPTETQLETMVFAWQTIKHVKSNAVLFADGTETVGIGMGQVSRVDAVRLAAMKAEEHAEGKHSEGAVMASDAFFPFPDGVEVAAEAGIEAVVQPGGSKNDDAVIAAADDHGLTMVFTGSRAFRHE